MARQEKKNEKRMVVCCSGSLGPSGPMVQRPVILPPLEAGSDRCSVKPASRRSCHSRPGEAVAFATAPSDHYTTWNGQANYVTPQAQAWRTHQTSSPP